MLSELDAAGIKATFFVEAINVETYAAELLGIQEAGHEVAFHAWCHEEWGGLDAEQERDNVRRSVEALRSTGIELKGFRPPGGRVSPQTFQLLDAEGLTHCSPAGFTYGIQDNVAVLPFEWQNVDVFHVLPQFAGLREAITGSEDAGGPPAVERQLMQALEAPNGHLAVALHTWMAEGESDQLRTILERVASMDAWVARHDEVAAWMLDHREAFGQQPELDDRSWMSGQRDS